MVLRMDVRGISNQVGRVGNKCGLGEGVCILGVQNILNEDTQNEKA